MELLLSLKNVSVAFGEETVIENLTFDLGEGENLTVIGPNGSGKTVLVKAILGILPHTGTIAWRSPARLGYVPQKIEADRHLPLNLRDLLAAKARVLALSTPDIDRIIKDVHLNRDILDTPIGHLSGGEFQRSLIAFALLGKPNVIIFDEPTASIDQMGEAQIYELIGRLQKEYKLTVILVSHDLSVVYRYATRVLCLNKRGICFGSPKEVLTPKILEQTYGIEHKFYHHDH